MQWSERQIASFLARCTFDRKHLVMVPNCSWPGSECDLLIVTPNLRVIDVEIKISRADLKADKKKDKWWRHLSHQEKIARGIDPSSGEWWGAKEPSPWPQRVWKHYYCMPAEIWKPELADSVPANSGILLIKPHPHRDGMLYVNVERNAKPNRQADRITPEDAVHVARLASLRMWDSYDQLDAARKREVAA